jgi:hypothetical protein
MNQYLPLLELIVDDQAQRVRRRIGYATGTHPGRPATGRRTNGRRSRRSAEPKLR